MASIDDYTSGRLLEQAKQALSLLKTSGDTLAGSDLGELMLSTIRDYQPQLLDMETARQWICAAHQCAVGPRACHPNHPEAEFSEAVFLDELAEGMVAAGKAQMVSKQEAIDTLAKYKKNPLVLSTVSGKPMELCRTSPETCIYWNMEKRGLTCIKRKPSPDQGL
jgi:hypothetical protein